MSCGIRSLVPARCMSCPSIRRRAIEGLRGFEETSRNSPAVLNCLVTLINKKGESAEIRRTVLDQLAEYGTKDAWSAIIQVATAHADPRLREEAIDELGPAEELSAGALPEVITCLESIVDNPKELEAVQRKALDTLKNIENPGILAYLKKTAQGHPNRNVRREAGEIVAQEMAESWNNKR
jgi:HEAT repeat protein